MARLEHLRIYPVKGLDGIDVDTAEVRAGGTLAGDREFALVDADGDPLNGKRTAAVHDLDAAFDPGSGTLTVETGSGASARRRGSVTFSRANSPSSGTTSGGSSTARGWARRWSALRPSKPWRRGSTG
jgi:uncharacterized protein YcbX